MRNLFRDKTRLLQTLGGSALVVLLVMVAAALSAGMEGVLSASGSPENVILMGTGSEESLQRSEIPEQAAGIAETSVPGVAERLGARAVSTEIHYMTHVRIGDAPPTQVYFRGIVPNALLTHPQVRLIEGRFPKSGEVMVGRLAWRKLGVPRDALAPGRNFKADKVDLRVSGIFAADGTVMESEFWAPIGDVRAASQRDTVSCVVLRLDDPDGFGDADIFAKQRPDLELSAQRESDYYARLSQFYRPVRIMTWITAGLIGAGAVFGGLNTLYAAFASRMRETATLQSIGFTRLALLSTFIQESMMACLGGTLVAMVLALILVDGFTIAFSIGAFTLHVTPGVVLTGLATGIALGVLGSIPPAIRCLRPPLPSALRSA